ncbi:nucleobase:cation symporter-2 family protein [Heyndrickxia coagulans]|uniref:Nucleobase:cation symporter-2 family protein n=1 Tax=Heyndrickxia coagulans TaxID=1398 RepID=A0AAW7CIY5_HEYCO|nr:nucleobase:cation symporter-2 family protein [Heyndrickxia coagulans]MDL5040838.1 nucleobase:cation symporter-2 family protein [Heyndrickxia coagulans]MDT9756021.1 nucleobase:cation symporter-2 family protein [Heyndrickxia coagulans]
MKPEKTKMTVLAIQHVLAMYAGAVIVPIITGSSLGMNSRQLTYLVSIDIFMSGLATLLQIWKNRFFGIGLPIMLGCTFTAVGPMIAIGKQYGVSAVYGAILVSGLFVILISKFFSKLARFFPPVVTGSVVTIIGVTLIPVAMKDMAGGDGSKDFGSLANIALSFGTLLIIVLLQRFAKGFIRSISILIGLALGTVAAALLGKVSFAPVAEASWVHIVQPFYFGAPTFEWSACITMILVALVSLVESSGVYFALSGITKQPLHEDDLARGYRAEGLAVMLGGLFNAFPYTAFSQNVGLIQLSGVKSKNVMALAGTFLLLFGLIPKLGALTTIIPSSVLGGAMIAMFGMVIASGIKMLSKVDFANNENLFIIACSIGIGLGVTVVPDIFKGLPSNIQLLTQSGIVAGSVTAIVLNLFFHILPNKQEAKAKVKKVGTQAS